MKWLESFKCRRGYVHHFQSNNLHNDPTLEWCGEVSYRLPHGLIELTQIMRYKCPCGCGVQIQLEVE